MIRMNKLDVILSYKDLRELLVANSEEKYQKFSAKLTPTEKPIIGVRTPKVRELAKLVSPEKIEKLLKVKPVTFEEVLFRGFLIGRLPYEKMVEWFDSQVGYIDNWATCDLFCSSLKVIKKYRDEFLEMKVLGLLDGSKEFVVRTGLVLLKCYYVDEKYLDLIFEWMEKLGVRKEYYIRMAIAWLLTECFIKFPTATTGYLVSSNLPKWTFNKTISKVCDSYRVDEETKVLLKRMRK